jgi:hypothetical protein
MNSQAPQSYTKLAAAIIIAAAIVSTSLIVAPLETPKTSTFTSVTTSTLPQITLTSTRNFTTTSAVTTTLPQATITSTRNLTTTLDSTTTIVSTTTVTTTVTVTLEPTSNCGTISTPTASTTLGAEAKASDPAPATVGTSNAGSATNSSSQRKTLTAAGLVWVFYTDGCNVVYQTSADGGKIWSSPPTIAQTGIVRGWFFTLAQSGNTVYFVCAASDGSLSSILFSSGDLNANGTITWSGSQDISYSGGGGTVPTVAVDTSGHAWVAIEDLQADGRHIEVFEASGGTWSEVFNLGGLADYPRPILLPLTSGKMALEILTETPGQRQLDIYTTADGGATWSSPVATSADNILTVSAIAVGDTVYSVTADTSGNVFLWTYAYGSSSFASPTALANCCSDGYDDATISTDGASFLFVAYSNSSSVIYETSADLGTSWTPSTAITTTENNIQPGTLATNPITSGLISVVWTSQSGVLSAAYDIRFASVTYDSQ